MTIDARQIPVAVISSFVILVGICSVNFAQEPEAPSKNDVESFLNTKRNVDIPEWPDPKVKRDKKGKTSAIPFELSKCRVVIDVHIGDESVSLALATETASADLYYQDVKSITDIKPPERFRPRKTTLPKIQIGDYVFRNPEIEVVKRMKFEGSDDSKKRPDMERKGRLGSSFFQKVNVTIDYEKKNVYLREPGHVPEKYDGVVSLLKANSNIPRVKGNISGVQGKFLFKTYSVSPGIVLTSSFYEEHRKKLPKKETDMEFIAGDLSFSDVSVFVHENELFPGINGHVSCYLPMQLKRVTIDYSKGKLFFVR